MKRIRPPAVALIGVSLLLLCAGVAAAKLPKVTPKTGAYTGKSVDAKTPGTLKVRKKHGKFRVASLKLTFHAECQDANGAPSEKDVPIEASGKFHKATVTTDQNKFVRSYKFTAQKDVGGGNTAATFNVEAEVISSKRVRVNGVYDEEVDDESGEAVSSCQASDSWRLSHH